MPRIVSIFIIGYIIVTSVPVNGQSDVQKSIVLINGTAHLVDIAPNGNLVNIYQSIDNYFTTKESHKNIIKRLSPGAISQGKSIILFEEEKEPVPSFAEENEKPVEVGNDQYIGFSPDRAILQKKAVDQVRKIAKNYRAGNISKINITCYAKDNYRSRSLSRNRGAAIQDLLIAFGVPKRILSSYSLPGNVDTKIDFAQISFRE